MTRHLRLVLPPPVLGPIHSPVVALVLATLLLASVSSATAGTWSVEEIGDGRIPGTLRVRVDVNATLDPVCNHCSFVVGTHVSVITPAPPVQDIDCEDDADFSDSRLRLRMYCVAGDGSVSWEMDVEPGVSYVFSEGSSSASWTDFGQGGSCTPETCTETDSAFADWTYRASTVAQGGESWSTLKAGF